MMTTGATSLPVTRSFRAHPSALYEIRRFVRECADHAALAERTTSDLLLAVSEACANCIVHTTTPDIRLTWATNGPCAEIEVRDQGIFRRRVRMPEIEGQGGHGIPLMMALVDEFSIHEGTASQPGTLVRLLKCEGS